MPSSRTTNAVTEKINSGKTVIMEGPNGPLICSPVDHYLPVIYSADHPTDRIQLIQAAIALDPHCPNIYFAKAAFAETWGDKAEDLHVGVQFAEELWQNYIANGGKMNWYCDGARPYLKALHDLAEAYLEMDDGMSGRRYRDASLATLEKLCKLDDGNVFDGMHLMGFIYEKYDNSPEYQAANEAIDEVISSVTETGSYPIRH